MLTVICGEDTVASRNYFNLLKEQYKIKNYLVEEITADYIIELKKGISEELSLFQQKKIFTVINLDKYINKKSALLKDINDIAKSKEIVLIDWEDYKSAWELNLKKTGTVKEFKPKENIFHLVESCYPGNKVYFLRSFEVVSENQDEQFIFIMLIRQMRNLILSRSNSLPSSFPSWQKYRLMNQAKSWQTKNLIKFYEGLHNIDVSVKTGINLLGLKKSIDILSCYYL